MKKFALCVALLMTFSICCATACKSLSNKESKPDGDLTLLAFEYSEFGQISSRDTQQATSSLFGDSTTHTNLLSVDSVEKIDYSNIHFTIVVKNEERYSFIDTVLYLSWLDRSVVFNEGKGAYVCASTTEFQDNMWMTKIDFSMQVQFDENFTCKIEIREINFLHKDKYTADLGDDDSLKTKTFAYVGYNVDCETTYENSDGVMYRYTEDMNGIIVTGFSDNVKETVSLDSITIKNYNGEKSIPVIRIERAVSKKVRNLKIGKNVSTISFHAFVDEGEKYAVDCKITVDEQNANYYVTDGCLIDRRSKSIAYCFEGFNIPMDENITAIGSFAYSYKQNESKQPITIPQNIETLEAPAFFRCDDSIFTTENGCNYLKKDDNPFYWLYDARIYEKTGTIDIIVNNKTIVIGSDSFHGLFYQTINSICFGSKITKICEYAFYNVEVKDIYYDGTADNFNNVTEVESIAIKIDRVNCNDKILFNYCK